ncbi:MAG: hypothetical protein V3V62_14420 [bacterium]
MTWIRPMRPDEAEGEAREIVEDLRGRGKPVPKLFLALGRRPEVLAAREKMRQAAHGGSSLGRRREELIAFYVAAHGG